MIIEVKIINRDTSEEQVMYVVGERMFSSRRDAEQYVEEFNNENN